MLKKAGVAVAIATAGMLALSPLAFAGDRGEHGEHGGVEVTSQENQNQQGNGFLNGTNVAGGNSFNACTQAAPINNVIGGLVSGLLGVGGAVTGGPQTTGQQCTSSAEVEQFSNKQKNKNY